jgi:hypothetical protein
VAIYLKHSGIIYKSLKFGNWGSANVLREIISQKTLINPLLNVSGMNGALFEVV